MGLLEDAGLVRADINQPLSCTALRMKLTGYKNHV